VPSPPLRHPRGVDTQGVGGGGSGGCIKG